MMLDVRFRFNPTSKIKHPKFLIPNSQPLNTLKNALHKFKTHRNCS
jgi:hypothetical protein